MIAVFLLPFANAEVNSNPSSWSDTYLGQVLSKTFTLSNDANSSVTVSLTKTGDKPEWINLSLTSFIIPNQSSATFSATVAPSSASPGVYIQYINFLSKTIPVIITVQSTQSNDCSLTPLITDFMTTVKAGTSPFTKPFSVTVSSQCTPLDFLLPMTIGTVMTETGEKPIKVSGALSLGRKNPGETANFDVEFDVQQMETGQYSPSLLITARNSTGGKFQTTINFRITVTAGVSPITGNISIPEYIVPSNIKAGEIFQIVAQNINPNLQPEVLPNKDIIAEPVSYESNNWVWKGKTNVTGNIKIQIVTKYKGTQIGGILEKTIGVVGGALIPSSSNITLVLFPSISELADNSNLTAQCKDESSKNIIPCEFYVNGLKLESNYFTVTAGKSYILSAANPSYNTYEINFTIKEKMITLNIPDEVMTGNIVDLISEPKDAIFTLDGLLIKSPYTFSQEGNFTLAAIKEGYMTATKTIIVKTPLQMTYSPESQDFKLGKEQVIEFNKVASWQIVFKGNKGNETTIASGTSSEATFLPKKRGIYSVFADGSSFVSYDRSGGFSIPVWIFWVIGIILAILAVLFVASKLGGGGGGSSTFIPSGIEAVEPIL